MTRLSINLIMLAGLYYAGAWVWQNMLPSSARSHLSAASQQAFSNLASLAK